MKKTKFNFIIAFILNVVLLIMECYSLISYYISDGIVMFRMYTEDSNIVLFLSSLFYVLFGLIKIFGKREIPHFVGVLRYIASCLITVTVVVIAIQVFFISQLADIAMFYQYEMIFHHTLCPIICLISFFCFEKYEKFTIKDTIFAFIPTFVYAIVLIILNILKITTGPYFFLEVYNQSIGLSILWFFVILIPAYLICALYMYLSNKKYPPLTKVGFLTKII